MICCGAHGMYSSVRVRVYLQTGEFLPVRCAHEGAQVGDQLGLPL